MQTEYSIENDKSIIYHYYRENGKRKCMKVSDFEPYFFVNENENTSNIYKVREENGFVNIFGKAVKKIVVKKPSDVAYCRRFFQTSQEADILFPIRFLIDRSPPMGDYPKVLYIDIECDDSTGFPEPELAEKTITAITCYDPEMDKYVTFVKGNEKKIIKTSRKDNTPHSVYIFENEEDLLITFIQFFRDSNPCIITGWNCYSFDMLYIINRMKKLNLRYTDLSPLNRITIPDGDKKRDLDIAGRTIFDLLRSYKRLHISGLRGYSLEEVAREELGIGKAGKGKRTFQMTLDELIEYNTTDVELCVALDKKVGVIKFFWELACFIGCPLNHTLQNSRMMDIWFLRKAKQQNIVLPSKTFSTTNTFEGAIVLQPDPGIYKNIVVLDLAKLYPSIIVSCNISPETVSNDGEINLKNGVRFKKGKGFVPSILLELFELRDQYKKEKGKYKHGTSEYQLYQNKEQFIKDLTNSVYGILSYPGFRLFAQSSAESITYMGRNISMWTKKAIETEGYKVYYGDTDSIMFQINGTKEEIIKKAYELQDILNKSYDNFASQYNIDKHYFNIKFEKLFDKILFLDAKKKYAGYLLWKDGKDLNDFVVTGFETKRSDSSNFTKNFQLELLKLVASGTDKKDVDKYISGKIDEMKKAKYEDLGIPKGINVGEGEAKVETIQLRASRYSNEHLGTNFKLGDKPKILYVKRVHGKPKTDVVAFDSMLDLTNIVDVDYEKMTDVLIMKKVENIYNSLGWHYVGKHSLARWLEPEQT